MNDEAVYRTAPATPGLLNTLSSNTFQYNVILYKFFLSNIITVHDPKYYQSSSLSATRTRMQPGEYQALDPPRLAATALVNIKVLFGQWT